MRQKIEAVNDKQAICDGDKDCEILVVSDLCDGVRSIERIGCRRDALAAAAYFGMLFARAQPTVVDRDRRIVPTYTITVPFDGNAVAFLLHRLHRGVGSNDNNANDDGSGNGNNGDAKCNLDQIIDASLFFGMPQQWVENLVVDFLRALADHSTLSGHTSTQTTKGSGNSIDAFALYLLESDLVGDIKLHLCRRFAYLLQTTPAVVRGHCYNPHVAHATARGDDGIMWHAVRLAFDTLGHGTNSASCAGIELSVSLVFESTEHGPAKGADPIHDRRRHNGGGNNNNNDGDANRNGDRERKSDANCRHDVILSIHSAPVGEQLGRWTRDEPFPPGVLYAMPCAMRARVRLYHPTRGIVVDDVPISSWCSVPTTLPQTGTGGAALRRRGVPVPHGFDRACQGSPHCARRAPRTATIAVDVDSRDRALWACEVALFLCPHDQGSPSTEMS